MFILWSVLLGIGLAMDAFAVSISNALNEKLKKKKTILIALVYALFQGLMPLIGFLMSCVFENYKIFVKILPLLGFVILMWLGIKTILDAFSKDKKYEGVKLSFKLLMIQGVATSIDALSSGIGIDNTIDAKFHYQVYIGILIIIVVTYIICLIGLILGDKISGKFEKKSKIIGGIILILIAIKILIEFLVDIL
ncbi:MAG: manganese efflux pump MntP family protein [Acholeplasmatales bacterium]|nr:manganese efflux pump MntP family protein [Acholeplasmatales bacterium]